MDFWHTHCIGSLSWKEIANICTKWEKVKRKKWYLKRLGFLFIFPSRKQPSFSSYVLKESVVVNFDVPSSVPKRALHIDLHFHGCARINNAMRLRFYASKYESLK